MFIVQKKENYVRVYSMNKIMFHASLLRYDKSDLKDQVLLVCKSNSYIPDGGDSLTVSEPKVNFDLLSTVGGLDIK